MELFPRLFTLLLAFGFASTALAAPPVLTAVNALDGSKEGTPTSIPFATFLAASNATDPDNDPIRFRLKSILSGTVKQGVTTLSAGELFEPGETWTWTPDDDDFNETTGLLAFSVTAYAAGDHSSPDVHVKIKVPAVNDAPSFTKGANQSGAEDSGQRSVVQWASSISTGSTKESSQQLTFTLTSDKPSLFSAGPAVSSDGTLTYTPAANENGLATIKIILRDDGGTANGGDDESAEQTFTILVTAVEDPPVVAGALAGTLAQPLNDASSTNPAVENSSISHLPFATISLADPDHDKPAAASQTVTVTVPQSVSELGNFNFEGFTRTSSTDNLSWLYKFNSSTPAAAETKIRAVTFVPVPNARPVGIFNFPISIELKDNTDRISAPFSSAIHIRSLNDPPQMTPILTVGSISDNAEVTPFRISVSDPDPGDSFSLTVTEPATETRGTLFLPSNLITGGPTALATAVQSIRYKAKPLEGNTTTVNAIIRFAVTDVHPEGTAASATSSSDLSLVISMVNDPPSISGIAGDVLRMTDNPGDPAVFPFPRVTIADPDGLQQLTVTLRLDDPAKGSFGHATALSGTAAEVTQLLRKVTFVPTPGRLPVNKSESVKITLTVSDGNLTASNNLTVVEVTAVNGAPAIYWDKLTDLSGTFPPLNDPALIEPPPAESKPFSKVTIEDEGMIAITVKLDNPAKGSFRDPAPFSETSVGSRTYKFTGSAAEGTTALGNLIYDLNPDFQFPPNQPGRSDFTITAGDSALNTTVRVLPVMLENNARNLLVTRVADDNQPGSLRRVIASAKNNDVITFALPSYPAVIRLNKTFGGLRIDKHLTFLGPGADKLTITGDSNSNGLTDENDVQLFRIHATVEFRNLRFSRGYSATTGGGFFVGRSVPGKPAGNLTLEDCTVANCSAAFWVAASTWRKAHCGWTAACLKITA